MKIKPDISHFTLPNEGKDPTDFLEGANADQLEKNLSVKVDLSKISRVENKKPEPTVQKLFRLRWDTANALKLGAAQESAATGKRVTETEIVENLIRKLYKIAR